MYFAKNELIELDDGAKYLVLDSAFLDDTAYYKVEEVIDEALSGNVIYISASNEDGKLYINESINGETLNKLTEIMN